MKKCPFCAEEIQDEAIKCKHCGGVLVSDDWRAFCDRYSKMSAKQQKRAFEALTEDQKTSFTVAWSALGYDKPEAAPALREKKKSARSTSCFTLVIAAVLFLGLMLWCTQKLGEMGSGKGSSTVAPAKEPIVDIHSLAGESPEEVEAVLGPGTRSALDLGGKHPTYYYGNEEYEVSFVDGKADWITIKHPGLVHVRFGDDALAAIGLPQTLPSFGNEHIKRWENYEGFREIPVFPRAGGGVHYILVVVRTLEH